MTIIEVNVGTGERREREPSAEEQAQVAQRRAEWDAGAKARHNAPILAEMNAEDVKIIRALLDGDTERINAHKAAQEARRAKLQK